jgi:hypothetical protein
MSLETFKASRAANDEPRKDLRFWKAENPHEAVFANATRLGAYNNARRAQALYYACLYDDAELAAMIQGSEAISNGVPQTMTTNIIRRQVDTYTAKIVKNRPLPMALTTGGDFGAQRRAKSITKFGEGALDTVGYFPTRELRIRDGAIFGSGFARNYRVGRKLHHDRMLPGEVLVDPRDGYYGKPRSIRLVHHIDRLVLIEQHPDFEEEIKQAAEKLTDDDRWLSMDDKTSDTVVVVEEIHLASADIDPDGKKDGPTDGAYAKCISNATLELSEYVRDYHPISKNDFQKPLVGYFGEGMVRQLAGLQYEINSVGLRLQEQGFMTGSYVWSQDGSGLEVDVLDNGAMSVIRSLTKPEFFTPAPWHPAFMEYHEALLTKRAQSITGISDFATRSELPPGMGDAPGIAIQHVKDTDTENLITQGREDERDCVDTMWQLFDLMEEIFEESKGTKDKYVVRVERRANGRSANEDMDYAKVRMDKKDFTLRTFPTSYLASTPSDRWEQVNAMKKDGYFSQDEALALLDFPDIQRVLNLRNSPRKTVEAIIEKLLDPDFDGTIVPESAMNLDLCVAIGALAYLEAKWVDDAPPELCDRVLAFSIAARALRDNAQPGTGAGPQPGSQDPMALPGELPPPDVNVPGMPAPTGPPGMPGMLPPAGPLAPPGAVAPTVMPSLPGGP